jgi:hypothetical protein
MVTMVTMTMVMVTTPAFVDCPSLLLCCIDVNAGVGEDNDDRCVLHLFSSPSLIPIPILDIVMAVAAHKWQHQKQYQYPVPASALKQQKELNWDGLVTVNDVLVEAHLALSCC